MDITAAGAASPESRLCSDDYINFDVDFALPEISKLMKKQLKHPKTIKFQDKLAFVFGVGNIGFTMFLLGGYPGSVSVNCLA
jgi:hypothetical protein